MPPSSPPPEDPWGAHHTAPTIADIELAPRRRLRDGSNSVASSSSSSSRHNNRSSASGRARTPHVVLGKRVREESAGAASVASATSVSVSVSSASSSHDQQQTAPLPLHLPLPLPSASHSTAPSIAPISIASTSTSSSTSTPAFTSPSASASALATTVNGTPARDMPRPQRRSAAEASRRLPRLTARQPLPRQQDSSGESEISSSDENDSEQHDSRDGDYLPPGVGSAPSPSPSPGRRASGSSITHTNANAHGNVAARAGGSAAGSANGSPGRRILLLSPSTPTRNDDGLSVLASRLSGNGGFPSSPHGLLSSPRQLLSPLRRPPSSSHQHQHPSPRHANNRSATNSADPSERRFTTAEKGKGRASSPVATSVSSGSDSGEIEALNDDSIQFIAAAPPEVIDIDEHAGVIDTEHSIGSYTCPVCFCAPTNPAFTPCGHVLCYSCLHATLLAAIQRQLNPYPELEMGRQPARKRAAPRRRTRGPRSALVPACLVTQPSNWTVTSLRAAAEADRVETVEDELVAAGLEGADADAFFVAHTSDELKIEHLLKGLWSVDGQYVIEGECPVCRKGIAGGLGPLGSRIGGVKVMETKVLWV